MTQAARKYRIYSFKVMVVALYLLFFAAQVNRHFYLAANFFVYSQAGPVKPEPHRLQALVKRSESARFHLRLDKRYQGREHIKVAPGCESFVVVVAYQEHRQVRVEPEEDLVTGSVNTICLRGPPATA